MTLDCFVMHNFECIAVAAEVIGKIKTKVLLHARIQNLVNAKLTKKGVKTKILENRKELKTLDLKTPSIVQQKEDKI